MKKPTDAEIAEFERQRSIRRMPGFRRLQAERGAALFAAAVKARKRKAKKAASRISPLTSK